MYANHQGNNCSKGEAREIQFFINYLVMYDVMLEFDTESM